MFQCEDKQAVSITVTGLVQGVGFRPFVSKLAHKYGLCGWVNNTNKCVEMVLEGEKERINNLVYDLRRFPPVQSKPETIVLKNIKLKNYRAFDILHSKSSGNSITRISPDMAVCDDCIEDMQLQENRLLYPLINCTNCGPRFTIINELPYDRINTSMAEFTMCNDCHSEYSDITDRRYHAQPVACNNCGPKLRLRASGFIENSIETILTKTAEIIHSGGVVAVKGMGGFQLICNALNDTVVENIRKIKRRDAKPFAVMAKDIDSASKYALINPGEKEVLLSSQRPVVLLNQGDVKLSNEISKGLNTVGLLLPYMPLHHNLFKFLNTDLLIFTSLNLSDEPLYVSYDDIPKEILAHCEAVLDYNRKIINRVDDSVCFVSNGKKRLIRRSRGYVPDPVKLFADCEGILAVGAELSGCFCIGKGDDAILSQHIGDLKNLATLQFFEETIEQFKRLFKFNPQQVVCDMHPDYLSSHYAMKSGLELQKVQHHEAHIASVMAEHHLSEPVIGVCMDGTGYGTDGNVWGGEFIVGELKAMERLGHIAYTSLPGGDNAVKEPWKMAFSWLQKSYTDNYIDFLLQTNVIPKHQINGIEALEMICKNDISVKTSSAGRLFDAVAAVMNICTTAKYHAQAPMLLESITENYTTTAYPFEISNVLDYKETFRAIVNDLKQGVAKSEISTKFHNTFVLSVFKMINKLNKDSGIRTVVLSGGVFQNRFVLNRLENKLKSKGFEVYTNQKVPLNDGNIALGQLAIGAIRSSSMIIKPLT